MANELGNTATMSAGNSNTGTYTATTITGTYTNTESSADTTGLDKRIKELESENAKLRQSVTNASADASKWKKERAELQEQLNSRMTDDEKAKAEQEAATAAMQKELETLRNERNIAKFTGALVAEGIGMDSETAGEVAGALNANEPEKVIEGIRKFVIAHDKALQENAIRNNPTLRGGITKAVSKEDFEKMGYKELVQLKNEHPDLYNEYMNKKE